MNMPWLLIHQMRQPDEYALVVNTSMRQPDEYALVFNTSNETT